MLHKKQTTNSASGICHLRIHWKKKNTYNRFLSNLGIYETLKGQRIYNNWAITKNLQLQLTSLFPVSPSLIHHPDDPILWSSRWASHLLCRNWAVWEWSFNLGTMGKPWENHGKTMGNGHVWSTSQRTHRKVLSAAMFDCQTAATYGTNILALPTI